VNLDRATDKSRRSKHHGKELVVRERHQRPRVKDLGTKWKIFYWDYSSGKRCAHTKSWAKSKFPTWAEAQREADQFIESVNDRNNQPQPFPFGEGTLAALVEMSRKDMAAAEELNENQLRLFSGHAHTAEVGLSETHENENH
jgi:hypothetical protein